MFWVKVFLIAAHSYMFGVGMSALGPYLREGDAGAIFNDIDMKADWKQAVATALTLLGAMVASLLSSIPVGKFGYRGTLLANSIIWAIGGVCCTFHNLYTFFLGRTIIGIGVGFSSTFPVLLSEISHNNNRGLVTSMHQLSITFGIFIQAILSYWMIKVNHGWWWMNSIQFIIMGVIMFITGFAVPESPVWLLKNGHDDEALRTLTELRKGFDYQSAMSNSINQNGSDSTPLLDGQVTPSTQPREQHMTGLASGLQGYDLDHLKHSPSSDLHINSELQQIKNQINSSSTEEISWGEVFQQRYRKQILIGTGLMMSSSLVGINAVTMFTTKIFGFAGLKGDQAIYGTIGGGFTCFFMSFISMVTIERLGRKTLFLIGASGCLAFLVMLGGVLLGLNNNSKLQGVLAVIGVLGYIMSFNTGLGAVPWCLLPEISASRIRSKLQSLFCFQNWFGNFIIVLSTLPLVRMLGGGHTDEAEKKGAAILFLLYSIFALGALLFGLFALFETKGLSEAQIQLKLGNTEGHGKIDDSIYATTSAYDI